MTKIKMCGLSRHEDIEYANKIKPDFIGFVFAEKSKRFVSSEKTEELVKNLESGIIPVGVFVNADISTVCSILERGIIKMVQLHGNEDNDYIHSLKTFTDKPVIQAFRIKTKEDILNANNSCADFVLLDSGYGSGELFNHDFISGIERPFFLAGGLTPENVRESVEKYNPYAVDASSYLETDGVKDFKKMLAFARAVKE